MLLEMVCILIAGQTPTKRPPSVQPAKTPAVARTQVGKHVMGEVVEDWMKLEPEQAIESSGIYYTSTPDRSYTWTFTGGRLTSVQVMPSFERLEKGSLRFEDELQHLTEIYGRPTRIEWKTYQNGFGASWRRQSAYWIKPDKAAIVASESSLIGGAGNLGFVIFVLEDIATKTEPNPYK